jgi:hypothetical protein
MGRRPWPAAALAAFLAAGYVAPASAQQPSPPYEPQIGQLGKDSVWAPTPDRLIDRMLQMADTTDKDYVIDLGSGDGRIPIAAAKKFGARSLGVEFDPDLVKFSISAAERAGVADRAKFVRQDLFETDLTAATVVTLYIGPQVTLKLRPKLLTLAPGTRVVSHQFTMGEWEPDEMARVENAPAYLWVVPAQVAGKWTLRFGAQEYDLDLRQTFQMLAGTAQAKGKSAPMLAARLRGMAIRFTIVDEGESRTFQGRVSGDTMEGITRAQTRGATERRWSARRAG